MLTLAEMEVVPVNFSHRPVLLVETIEALGVKPDGIYVDGTAGGGGHSGAVLSLLSKAGRLIAVDQDPEAVYTLKRKFEGENRVFVVQENFSNIDKVLAELGVESVDGVLLDIGVSSRQLDTPERGFSFHEDAPLDMRMSKKGPSAYDLVNTLSEKELADIIFRYGEEKQSRRIARGIVAAREQKTIKTTKELSEIIKESVPAAVRREGHPARKTFQAIRIEVNRELDVLKEGLLKAFDALNSNGRLAVITFHSLEDRIVKQQMSLWCKGCTCPDDFPVCVCGNTPKGELVFKKPKTASQEELDENPRSRSAKLRAIIKI